MGKTKNVSFNSMYISVTGLITTVENKVLKFAFEYLDGGCNKDIDLHKYTKEICTLKKSQPHVQAHLILLLPHKIKRAFTSPRCKT